MDPVGKKIGPPLSPDPLHHLCMKTAIIACCRQPGSKLLHAGEIRLVGTTCNKPRPIESR